MTTHTEANLNEALDWIQKTGGAIQDFASEQAPIYCREVVAWELWIGAFYGSFGLLLFVIGCFAAATFVRWMVDDDGEPNGRTVTSFFVAFLALAGGSCMFLTNAPQAIKAAVSPRLVIVEHLSKLRR